MAGKGATVKSIDRIVDANLNISELVQRPEEIRQWFSNNIIRPAFSYLVGWTGTNARMIRVTSNGILKTASVGSGLERVETSTGTATAAESADIALANTASRIRVIANTYDMYLRTSRDGINYEDQIHIKHDVEQVFDIVTASFRVQRYDVNDTIYELEAYR